MEELEQNKNLAEAAQLTKQERKQLKKQRKREERQQGRSQEKMKKIITIAVIILVVGGGIFALGWFFSTGPSLPPTSQLNHSELSPPAHIVTSPIPAAIQKHMLEHADGGGKPGVIIQYNCEDFACEQDLVDNLTELVKRYPANVYLAPNNYDGKIILTKLGRRQILEEFNQRTIEDFIGR
ncbi:hypothetical protein IH982_01250 [Patescibacteria group bacterium]|nr:hypothetical protein [Patescibacteria group bacterium]